MAVLRQARLRAGGELRIEAEDGRIVISRARDALDEFIGDIPGLSDATNLQQLRNE